MLYLHNYAHSYVWKNYRILFIPTKYSNIVEKILDDEKIQDVISKQSVKRRFQNIDENSFPFTLQELYTHWFENESDDLSYIYINQKSYVPFEFLKILTKKNIPFYLEGEPHLHYINFICALFLLIFFLIFSNKKSLFFFTSLPFLLASFLITNFLMLCVIALFLLSDLHIIEVFFTPPYLNQEQRKIRIKKNSILFIIPSFAFILLLFDTYLSYIYIFLSILASFSIGYLIEKLNYLLEKEKAIDRELEKITFFAMHPHFIEKIWAKKKAILSLVLFCLSFIPYVVFFLFCVTPLPKNYTNPICLPMPSMNKTEDFSFSSYSECLERKSGDALPDLTNYVLDTWFYNVCPYLDANLSTITFPKEDESVIFRDFYNAGCGIIKEKEPLIFTFNNTFIQKTLESIPSNSIEEILKKEDGFVSVFYDFKIFPINRCGVILSFFSLLFIFLSWIIILFKMCY